MNDDEIAAAHKSLAVLLAAIGAGGVEATREQVAYLQGAADTLAGLCDRED